MHGNKIPPQLVTKVGDAFKRILEETEKIRDETANDMSVLQGISIVLDRNPELRYQMQSHCFNLKLLLLKFIYL